MASARDLVDMASAKDRLMAELQLLFAAYARDQQRLEDVIRENARLRRQLEASTIALGYSENDGWWRDHTPAENQKMRDENAENVRRHRQRLLESEAAAPLGSSEDEADREQRQMEAECDRQEEIAEDADRLGQQYLQDGQQYLQDAKRRKVLTKEEEEVRRLAKVEVRRRLAKVRELTDALAESTATNTNLQNIIERQALHLSIVCSELVKLEDEGLQTDKHDGP